MSIDHSSGPALLTAALAGTWGWLLGTDRGIVRPAAWPAHECVERSCEGELRRILELQAEVWWLRQIVLQLAVLVLLLAAVTCWLAGCCACACLRSAGRGCPARAQREVEGADVVRLPLAAEQTIPPVPSRGPLTPAAKAALRC